jgi:hypothetical protein
MIAFGEKTVGPFGGKNTINSYGCLRYNPALNILLQIQYFSEKKNLGLEKCNQIILLSSMTSLKTLHI